MNPWENFDVVGQDGSHTLSINWKANLYLNPAVPFDVVASRMAKIANLVVGVAINEYEIGRVKAAVSRELRDMFAMRAISDSPFIECQSPFAGPKHAPADRGEIQIGTAKRAAFVEDKFLVINRKRIEEMLGRGGLAALAARDLLRAVDAFGELYEVATNRPMNQKYHVCNRDEPYADEVIRVILGGEARKGGSK